MWWKGILLSSTNETERVLLHYIFSMYSASGAWLMHIHTLSSRFELSKKYLYSDYYLEVCNFCERHAGHLKGLTTSSFWMGYNEYPKKFLVHCPNKKCTKHAQQKIIAVSTCIRSTVFENRSKMSRAKRLFTISICCVDEVLPNISFNFAKHFLIF